MEKMELNLGAYVVLGAFSLIIGAAILYYIYKAIGVLWIGATEGVNTDGYHIGIVTGLVGWWALWSFISLFYFWFLYLDDYNKVIIVITNSILVGCSSLFFPFAYLFYQYKKDNNNDKL